MYDGAATAALMGITFSVAPGEFVSVIGTSGAGKSTLLRCINRMVNQQVVISDDRRCKTGWVFTQPVFYAID